MNSSHDIARSALAAWRTNADPGAFPYDAVVAAIHSVGKHFAAPELLADLDDVRRELPRGCPAHGQLARFLDTALDKHDGRYDQPSYLACRSSACRAPTAARIPATPHASVTG